MLFWLGIFRLGIIGGLCLAVAGCDATIQSRPGIRYDVDRDPLTDIVLDHRLKKSTVEAALDAPDDLTRNQIVFARMAEIDALYNTYETEILAEATRSGFALSFGNLIAGLLGGFYTGETSQVFSLIGGGIGALQTSYDKEILAESTIQAFISQMRAGRADVRAQIYSRLARPATAYPVEAALTDLERYRQAGTLATAIAGITEQAALEEATSSEMADEAVNEFLVRNVAGPDIPASDLEPTRVERLDAIATRIKIPAQVSSEKLVAFLQEPPTDDPNLKTRLEEIREGILDRPGVSELTPEAINTIARSRIAVAVLEASGDPIVDKLEELFSIGG